VADRVPLSAVRVGSTLLLPCKLTAKGAGGVTLEIMGIDRAVTGSFSVSMPSAVIAGAFTTDPRDQPVKVVAFALTVGDMVRNSRTGDVVVVQAVGLGPDGGLFSNSTSGRQTFSTEDWEPYAP
jgi:hypothetical protein